MKTTDSLSDHPSNPARNVKLTRNRILVVDDDSSVREMLTRVLVGEGYLVWSAANGAAALELAAANKIDLVLLDLNLPGKSGWQIFQKFMVENPLLTVIIITARSNQLFTALGAGVAALLEKPFNFPALLQTVGRLLAEPMEMHRARTAGQPVDFQYLHAQPGEPEANH
jgi:two-component system aerobic respiration control protein ArcA